MGRVDNGQYVPRALSFVMSPVIAQAILSDQANQFFRPLPATGGHHYAVRTAQFTFPDFVVAVQRLLCTTVPILQSDIQPSTCTRGY